MGRYGHSEERLICKPLFAMTNSQICIKELLDQYTPKIPICQGILGSVNSTLHLRSLYWKKAKKGVD